MNGWDTAAVRCRGPRGQARYGGDAPAGTTTKVNLKSAVELPTPDTSEQPSELPRHNPEPRPTRILGVPHPDHAIELGNLNASVVVHAAATRTLAPPDHRKLQVNGLISCHEAFWQRSNSPRLMRTNSPPNSRELNPSRGPCGSLESRTPILPPRLASSTQASSLTPPLYELFRHFVKTVPSASVRSETSKRTETVPRHRSRRTVS